MDYTGVPKSDPDENGHDKDLEVITFCNSSKALFLSSSEPLNQMDNL